MKPTTLALFDMAEQKKTKVKKPDLIRAWMRRHGITVHFEPHMKPWCWTAWVGSAKDVPDENAYGEGKTRNEALKELAERESIPTWDQEKMRKQ